MHAREKVDPATLAKAEAQAWLRHAVAVLAEQKERIEVCGSTCCPFPIKLKEWHEGHEGDSNGRHAAEQLQRMHVHGGCSMPIGLVWSGSAALMPFGERECTSGSALPPTR